MIRFYDSLCFLDTLSKWGQLACFGYGTAIFVDLIRRLTTGQSQKHLMTSTKWDKGNNGPHALCTRDFGSYRPILPRQSRFASIVSVVKAWRNQNSVEVSHDCQQICMHQNSVNPCDNLLNHA